MLRFLTLTLLTGSLLVGVGACNRKKTPATQADLLTAEEERRDRDQDRTGGPEEVPGGTKPLPQ
jgi:hypothetical protein